MFFKKCVVHTITLLLFAANVQAVYHTVYTYVPNYQCPDPASNNFAVSFTNTCYRWQSIVRSVKPRSTTPGEIWVTYFADSVRNFACGTAFATGSSSCIATGCVSGTYSVSQDRIYHGGLVLLDCTQYCSGITPSDVGPAKRAMEDHNKLEPETLNVPRVMESTVHGAEAVVKELEEKLESVAHKFTHEDGHAVLRFDDGYIFKTKLKDGQPLEIDTGM